MWSSSLVLGLLLTATPTPSGSATVPLQELIPLYVERQAPPPPTEALVVQSQLKGHLTPEALLVEAHFEVEVLTSDRWSRVQLLQLGPGVYLTGLPTLEGAAVGALEGQLCFVSQKPGRYSFDVRLTVRPSEPGPEHSAELRYGPHAVPVPLRLEADTNAFTLLEPQSIGTPTLDVYPRQGAIRVRWSSVAAPAVARQTARPPLEPSIPEAQASWVSTLEGKATVHLRYALKLDREQELELELPQDLHLKQVLLNALPLVATEKDGHVRVKVAPARLGETEGTLEVMLAQELGSLHLSGQLRLTLPRVAWPVASLSVQAHLPAVFNYQREGGSMEQYESSEQEAPASQALPGKVLHFRQFLMAASAPTLELGYSVDISQSYFR
ncbi:MAG: hypothetical protein ACJ8AT_04320 [Hyalangium sp.]|uniref:hypothetical protein n=1 Tax=Hyalangium sp. TaxID=2028555 RepID=UPI003899AE83